MLLRDSPLCVYAASNALIKKKRDAGYSWLAQAITHGNLEFASLACKKKIGEF